jgi:hypothetical protein
MSTANTTVAQANQQFRESLIRDANHSERLAITFEGQKVTFLEAIKRVLDDYGLAQKLELAKQQGHKLRILQVNCTEGLYLHELARLLEERNLLEGADLYGITEDATQISTADVYSKMAKPPRPYLNFYQHNLHDPLTECLGLHEGLQIGDSVQFDLIFGANQSLELSKGAKTILSQLYLEGVKPGGLIYFTEFLLEEGPNGFIAPHPAIGVLNRLGTWTVIQSYNPGVEVAIAMTEWLRELGAEQVADFKTVLEVGGQTVAGRAFMRSTLWVLKTTGPEFVKAGLISQTQYDEFMQVIYQELTPQHVGQVTFNTTMARKPLS